MTAEPSTLFTSFLSSFKEYISPFASKIADFIVDMYPYILLILALLLGIALIKRILTGNNE